MTGKKYYYLAFLSPIFLPIFVMVVEWVYVLFTGGEIESSYSGFLMMTILFGGIPYFIFLAGFYLWANYKDGKQIHYFTYLAPIIYVLVFLPYLAAFILVTDPSKLDNIFSFFVSADLWEAYYLYGKIALVVSYAYIILFNIGYWILKANRHFK